MGSPSCVLSAVFIVCWCAAANAAVKPLDVPSMAVLVEAGEYTVRGRIVKVASTVELKIQERDAVRVAGEEQVLSDAPAQGWGGGTSLQKVLGPVDKGTRLPNVLDRESVVVYEAQPSNKHFIADKDYKLDRLWGGLSRVDGGAIPKGGKVFVDYVVYQQRIDVVQVSKAGAASIKKGASAAVCAAVPEPDPGCTAIANIYINYQTSSIGSGDIYPLPEKPVIWQDYIKTSGRDHLKNTLGLLRSGKPLTVVCWGDSVTEGGSPSSHDKCYVELLRSRLRAAYPKSHITLINAGIGGSNTNSRRDGYEKEVLSHHTDLITVEFVNDIGMGSEEIRKNWTEFIARARQQNPNVEFILITPHNVMPEWMGNFKSGVDAMRRAAVENRVALADANNVWMNLGKMGIPYFSLLANGINHPDDLGHDIFATSIMQLLHTAE